ncbi:MAG: HD domain-containing protein [Spirochaetes bacterium]|nr:HD domain-containing protein [Spirochaetota bacterium]
MKKIPISGLEPGMRLAEDLFRVGDRQKRVPLFSYGILLTEKNIMQIKRLFPSENFINVFDKAELMGYLDSKDKETPEIENAEKKVFKIPVKQKLMFTKPIPYDLLMKGDFSREKAAGMFNDSIFRNPVYRNTKKIFKSYFSRVTSMLSSFITTGDINETEVMNVAQSITSDLVEGTEYFDPSLVYLVELEEWDQTTFNHSFDVGVITLYVASYISDQYEELTSLFIAGLLHDIGKFIYSKLKLNDMDYIIKKQGRLTDEEYEHIKKHVDVEAYIKNWFPNLPVRLHDNIYYGITEHHERFNGKGYLKGKKGQNISFSGRLIAVCDVYDALIRRRSYKSLLTPSQAIALLLKINEEGQFDRGLFRSFLNAMGRYPTGGVVMTDRGVAVVSSQNQTNYERPFLIFPNSTEEVNSLNEADIKIMDMQGI